MAVRGRAPRLFREALDGLLQPSRLAPYLLVPPLLALMVTAIAETPQLSPARAGELTLALSCAACAVSLVAGYLLASQSSRNWSSGWFRGVLMLPGARDRAYWMPLLAHLLVAGCVLALTCAAIIAAVPDLGIPWGMLGSCAVSLAWSSGAALLAAAVTGPGGASVLTASIVVVSYLPMFERSWLAGAAPPWALPVFGRLALAGADAGEVLLAASIQAVLLALAGWLVFRMQAGR